MLGSFFALRVVTKDLTRVSQGGVKLGIPRGGTRLGFYVLLAHMLFRDVQSTNSRGTQDKVGEMDHVCRYGPNTVRMG